MSLTVTISPLPPLPELAALWTALERQSAPSFFKTWTWVGSWLEASARPNLPPDSIQLVRVEQGGSMVGLAVVCVARIGRPWGSGSTGFLLGETGIPQIDALFVEYNGVLAKTGLEQKVTAATLRALCARWPVGNINRLALEDFEAVRDGYPTWRLRRVQRCPLICVQGPIALESYLNQLGSNTRQQVRRSIRLFGNISISTAGPDETHATMEELIHLHSSAWAKRGRRTDAFGTPSFDRFAWSLLTPRESLGVVELTKVAAGDKTIGILMNFRAGAHIYAYQSGFSVYEDNRLKPGLVCHTYAAIDAFRRGATAYHFMAGQGRYKSSLGNQEEALYSLDIGRPSLSWRVETALMKLKEIIGRSDNRS